MANTEKTDIIADNQTFGRRLKTMFAVDFRRMFTMPLFYIMAGIAFVIPILILVMTTGMGGEGDATDAFTSVWQAIASMSGDGLGNMMSLTNMCNMNMVYFLMAVLVCLFISEDFRSGYSKNLFTVRAKKLDYVVSKTVVCFVGGIGMLIAFFLGAMLGGGIAGLSFGAGAAGAGGIIACLFSKILLAAVFVAIFTTVSIVAKHRTWLCILLSLAVSMMLFAMIPMLTPLDANIINIVICLACGAVFSVGLGAVSVLVLKKTSLI